jgi:hypothetical protein
MVSIIGLAADSASCAVAGAPALPTAWNAEALRRIAQMVKARMRRDVGMNLAKPCLKGMFAATSPQFPFR